MKKPLVIVLLMLLFPTAADIASAQEQPYAGDTIHRREVKMIPAYDPSDGFIVCDYQKNLLPIVPENYICGYTIQPNGFREYGLFLIKDSDNYHVVLRYYKVNSQRYHEISTDTLLVTVEQALELAESARNTIDNAVSEQPDNHPGLLNGQFIVFFDGTIIKALMPGKSAKIWADEIPDPLWNGQYHQFKRLLSGVNVPDTEVISNDTLMGSAPPHPIVFGPDPEWWKFGQRAKLRRYIRRLEKGNYIRVVKNKRINS